MTTYIYGLCHPTTDEVFYVGKTTHLKSRLSSHLSKALTGPITTPVRRWIRHLISQGLEPKLVVLYTVKHDESWQSAERYWISKYDNLLNVCDGGNGSHTRNNLPKNIVELLGKISDGRISEMLNCSREKITYHRKRLGIERAHDFSRMKVWKKGRTPHNKKQLPEDFDNLLGKIPDYKLGKKFGLTKNAIRNRRIKLNIQPFRKKIK